MASQSVECSLAITLPTLHLVSETAPHGKTGTPHYPKFMEESTLAEALGELPCFAQAW